MPGSTSRGVPHAIGSDAASTIDESMTSLAQWLSDNPGSATLTTAARDALSGAALWTGRAIYNTTLSRQEVYNGVAWVRPGITAHADLSGLAGSAHPDHLLNDGTTTLLGALYEGVSTADTTTSYALDWSAAPIHSLTLTGSCVFTFSNVPPAGGAVTLILKQDGTGSRTATWPAAVKWAEGTAPTITEAANSEDVLTFVTPDGGANVYGFIGGQDFS
jgi:hypothetical protein